MKVLVTGADGFIGSVLCRELENRGFKVFKVCYLKELGDNSFRLDLTRDSLEKLPKQVDAVVHLAGVISYSKSVEKVRSMFNVNVGATKRVARKYRDSFFIHFSSVSVYGEIEKGRCADENYPCNPENCYGVSKLMSEEVVKKFCKELAILRVAPVYGKLNKIWEEIFTLFLLRFPVPAVDSLTHLCHIKNVTSAVATLLEKGYCGTFNVADKKPVRFLKLVKDICSCLGKEPRIIPRFLFKPFYLILGEKARVFTRNRCYKVSEVFKPVKYKKEYIRKMVEEYLRNFSHPEHFAWL